ncbi:diguanylate cyclase [Legionella anisa]|uniref:diguanylate cyclase n=1 Tax=Legionella anisa TaxID=28082 RepID=A0AAX0WZB5_9GAMM|nr:diguanylate cyclase [Legionella anisa]KTC70076.1 sensor histidine kinase [Legionella anisa]MBN5936559.1 diguanylate cyclase [Legionella anisa]PNL73928.1 PAS domain S-box protein [Legionella anisa]UAK81418.1 diguanylate cyclase [Legionella anisa]
MNTSQNYKKDTKTILEAVPDLYLILSPQLNIVGASDVYLKTMMVKREEILGRYLFDVIPDDTSATRVKNLRYSLERVLKDKTCDAMAIQKYDVRRSASLDGDFEERYWRLLNCPVLDKENQVQYIIHRMEDITEFIRLQKSYDLQLNIIKKLQRGKGISGAEKLKEINDIQKVNKKLQEGDNYNAAFLAAIPDAMILVNQEGKIEFSNNQAEDMFGYTKEELLGQLVEKLMPEKAAKIHPQHRDNYFKSPRVRPMGLGMELQGKRKNGEIFSVEISLSPLQTTKGLAAIATIRDVTLRVEQNQLLQQNEKSLRELYETLEKEKLQLESINQKMFTITQLSETFLACNTIEEILESFSSFAHKILDFSDGALYLMHNSRNYLEKKIIWGDLDHYPAIFSSNECWALRRGCIHEVSELQPGVLCQHIKEMKQAQQASLCIPLMAQNEILGLLFIYKSMEKSNTLIPVVAETISLAIANIRLKELLHSQSIRDPLTGLLNRRFLDEYIVKQIGQAKRNKTSIVFIMVDVDNFKRVNDNFGHETGDYVLSRLGNLIPSLVREGDLACRYGGEEFLFVLPNFDANSAKACGENIRNKVNEMRIVIDGSVSNITISLGISVFPNDGTSSKELIDAADQALYTAKKHGKNRTVLFSELND